MESLAGPYYAAALLVGAAGFVKLARPAAATHAVRAAGFPASRPLVRLLGAAEVAVAVSAVAAGRPGALLLGAAFAGFAAYTVLAARRSASCGCFGAAEAPLGPIHVVANLTLAALALAVFVWPLPGPQAVLRAQPGGAAPFALITVLAAYLLYLTMTRFAALRRVMLR